MRNLSSLSLVSVLVAIAAFSGCGDNSAPDRGPLGTVSGTVTFDGQPVTEGTVDFYNNDKGIIAHATIGSDGKFQLSPATAVGKYGVTVSPPAATVAADPAELVEDNPNATAAPPAAQKEYPNIPQKYRAAATSGLTIAVKEGENPFDIKMVK